MQTWHLPAGYVENPVISNEGTDGEYWPAEKVRNGMVWQADVYRAVARMLGPSDTVVDVGCGTGAKLRHHLAPVAARAIGVDQGSGIAAASRLAPEGEWVAGDLSSDALWDEVAALSPDVVVCSDVIEHLEDPGTLLDRLRALAATGRLVISTPDRARLYGPDHLGPPSTPLHVREWTADEFRLLLEEHGFEVEDQFHVMARDRWGLEREVKEYVWKVLHRKRPGRHRTCMAFVCRPRRAS